MRDRSSVSCEGAPYIRSATGLGFTAWVSGAFMRTVAPLGFREGGTEVQGYGKHESSTFQFSFEGAR
jgi:hypothetical protein